MINGHPNIRFIIDESYLPFVPEGEAKSLIRSTLPNVIVLNSMSKIRQSLEKFEKEESGLSR